MRKIAAQAIRAGDLASHYNLVTHQTGTKYWSHHISTMDVRS